MKTPKPAAVALSVITRLFFAQGTHARNNLQNYNIQEAVKRGMEEGILLENVRLFFAAHYRFPNGDTLRLWARLTPTRTGLYSYCNLERRSADSRV